MAKPKGRAMIANDLCKGCGLCVSTCPLGIIALDSATMNIKGYAPAMVQDPSRCIGCGNCGIICPDSVITVERFSRQRRGADE